MTTPKSPMEQFLDEDVATAIAPLRGVLDDGVLEAFGDAWRDAVYGEAPLEAMAHQLCPNPESSEGSGEVEKGALDQAELRRREQEAAAKAAGGAAGAGVVTPFRRPGPRR